MRRKKLRPKKMIIEEKLYSFLDFQDEGETDEAPPEDADELKEDEEETGEMDDDLLDDEETDDISEE